VLGGERFGLPLACIREFAAIRQVAPVPGCPPHIVGNMNLRGDIVTLVDIRSLLNLPPTGAVHRAVIISTDGMGRLGVPVDDVDDVVYLRSADRKPVPAGLETGAEAWLAEIASDGERTLPIVDLDRVFAKGQLVVDQAV
jgi:purine-binding chemotaxis protein CheW